MLSMLRQACAGTHSCTCAGMRAQTDIQTHRDNTDTTGRLTEPRTDIHTDCFHTTTLTHDIFSRRRTWAERRERGSAVQTGRGIVGHAAEGKMTTRQAAPRPPATMVGSMPQRPRQRAAPCPPTCPTLLRHGVTLNCSNKNHVPVWWGHENHHIANRST